jgi:hypothetical protein
MGKWLWLIFACCFFTFGICFPLNYAKLSRRAAIHLQGHTRENIVFYYDNSRRIP